MEDFSNFQTSVQSALVSTTRSASTLANEDLPFHRSLSTKLSSRLDRQNARLLGLASNLLGAATSTSPESVGAAPSLKDVDSIEGNWRSVVDVIDSLLERADTALDEFTGAVKRLTPDAEVQVPASKALRPSKIAQQLKAQEMEKPQLYFDNVPTNTETEAFRPLLQSKPHAMRALETEPAAIGGTLQTGYPHPYQCEIEKYRYPTTVYTRADAIPYHPFDSTSATFVDTEEALAEMLEELMHAKEIAIDLEHHDQRSYAGIVCLMQISTRNRDWIVDTLKPWRRRLQCLNEVFANPNIIKVLHGAYMDIVWLQRDLGLYIVGLFDTHYAARALGYPGGSLAFLLKKFVNFDANKQYQLADWRIRPLPQELLDYARSDTHYLLYIFDCMRNELIQRSNFELPDDDGDKLLHVLQKSSHTALQRYEHHVYDAELGQGSLGWYKLLSRTPALFSKEQFAVFRAVHQWRDTVAREQDDSVHYVMPNHQVFSIARELPTNRAALLSLAQPTTQSVRLRAGELVDVITKARESSSDGPEMLDVLNKIEPHNSRGPLAKADRSHSVAAFVPQKPAPVDSAEAAGLPLRSATSTFWGGTLRSEPDKSLTKASEVSLYVPLPQHSIEMLEESEAAAQLVPVDEPSSPMQAEEADAEDEDIIVLKELGKKRKRNLPDNTSSTIIAQDDEILLEDEETAHAREKAERKKAKKEAKKAAAAAAQATTTNGDTEEAFDYASAPSILNPPREDGRKVKGAEGKKQVKPYSKMLDAPKGLPRNPAAKEKAGKSMTYR